jgi:hypothetical protein
MKDNERNHLSQLDRELRAIERRENWQMFWLPSIKALSLFAVILVPVYLIEPKAFGKWCAFIFGVLAPLSLWLGRKRD